MFTDLETDPKDSRQKTSDENIAPGTQDFTQAKAPSPKTDLPDSRAKSSAIKKPHTGQKYDSANNEKVLAFSPNEVNEKKIFVLKEKTLNESDRREVAEKTVPDDVHKSDSAFVDSGFTSHSAVDSSLVTLLKPRSYEAEQFKILRTNLLFPESGHPTRSVLITSASPGDGKSFISTNLAVSLALNYDRKVLLIDADVRRSETQSIFGLNHVEKGICDFLSGRIPLTSLLVKTSLSNLFILPAGKRVRGQAELRSLENLPKLFEELEAHFNEYFIVVDSPPPKLASETGVLARLVDSIVIVVKSGVTKRKLVEDTIDLIDKGKIAGIVFNWHENRMSTYKKYAQKRGYYS
jgi:capsular exopolysaccharide synthesis family protein